MIEFKTQENLAQHTTFGIGGPADFFYIAQNTEDLVTAIKQAREEKLPFFILGGGSNVLISDKGFRGLVIKNQANQAVFKGQEVTMDSGVILADLVNLAIEQGLSGLEYFASIPGTLGGALYNNAHYNQHLIGKLVSEVKVLDKDNEEQILSGKDCQFAYEQSRFQTSGEIILKATLRLKKGDQKKMDQVRQAAIDYRLKNHPKGKSAGSVFQNPASQPAAQLIEQAGLKGLTIGGAMVSQAHAGFIVNQNQAKASDVLKLIQIVKEKVKEKFKVELKEEIFFIGEKNG